MSEQKSGRLNLKVPRSLHADLAILAEREHVSLNYLVGVLLSAEVAGMKQTGRVQEPTAR